MGNKRGHFIVVEGLEGAGKSTALTTIYDFLKQHVDNLILTREPGGTYVGETARHLIKDVRSDEPLDARAELLLFYAARVQLVECVIRPALQQGASVLADRFELSTFAYQGGGRKMDLAMIQHLSTFCLQGLTPDLTVFLDVAPELGLERVLQRGKFDRIEQESLEFFNNVRDSYYTCIKKMNNVVVIDANKPIDMVQKQIHIVLEEYISKHAIN